MPEHESTQDALDYINKVGMHIVIGTHFVDHLPKEVVNDAREGVSGAVRADTAHKNGHGAAVVLHHLKPAVDRLTAAGSALMKHQDKLAENEYAPTGMLSDIADAGGTGELQNSVEQYADLANKGS